MNARVTRTGSGGTVAAAARSADHPRLHHAGEMNGAAAGAVLVLPAVLIFYDVNPATVHDTRAGRAVHSL